MRIVQEGVVNTRPHFTLGRTGDRFRVTERREGDVWISILLHDGGFIEFPDFIATVDGLRNGLDHPDDTPRDVYLSPHRRNLVITKHMDSTTKIGNVYRRYHRSSARMIRVGGMRFDEACVRHYCGARRIPVHAVTGGGRDVFPMAWRGEDIGVFDIASSDYGFQHRSGARSVFFRVEFDFARGRILRARDVQPWR